MFDFRFSTDVSITNKKITKMNLSLILVSIFKSFITLDKEMDQNLL